MTKLFLKSFIFLNASLFDYSSEDDWCSELFSLDSIFFNLKVNFLSSLASAFLLLIPWSADCNSYNASLTSESYSSSQSATIYSKF